MNENSRGVKILASLRGLAEKVELMSGNSIYSHPFYWHKTENQWAGVLYEMSPHKNTDSSKNSYTRSSKIKLPNININGECSHKLFHQNEPLQRTWRLRSRVFGKGVLGKNWNLKMCTGVHHFLC